MNQQNIPAYRDPTYKPYIGQREDISGYLDPRKKEDVAKMDIERQPLEQQMQQINYQEPFAQTTGQKAFLDFLGGQVYDQNSKGQQQGNYLKGQIQNPMDTLAQQQLANSTQGNMASSKSMLGSTRGMSNPALLGGMVANQTADIAQQGAGQADILKQQELTSNLGAYGNQLQGNAAQDLAQQQLYGGVIEGNRQSNEDRMRLIQAIYTEKVKAQTQKEYLDQQQKDQFISTLGEMGVTLGVGAVMSDRNKKMDIKDGEETMLDYLDSLSSNTPKDLNRSTKFLDYIG